MLEVRRVSKSFRGLRAVNDASFEVPAGSINGLIGPNGAGKTTIFNVIAGVYAPDGGEIVFEGKRIDGLRPDQVCAAGIGRTFQLVKPFAGLTVLDNVIVGPCNAKHVAEARGAADDPRKARPRREARSARFLAHPSRPQAPRGRARPRHRPRLLLLDEVMAGLRPTECDQMVEVFRDINRAEGLTILLIEHVMRAVMALAQHIGVLHHGVVIARGTPEEVVRDPAVLECYLGEETKI